MSRNTTRFILVAALFSLAFATTGQAQIRINEVHTTELWVEFVNNGTEAVDVSSYWLCNRPAYAQLSTLNARGGSTTLGPGEFLVVDFSSLSSADAEVGLYTSSSFGDASAMVDYMQYGAAGHGRESVAVAASLWTMGEFVALPASGLALSNTGGTGLSAWTALAPTPGAANAQATATSDDQIPGFHRLGAMYPNPVSDRATFELSVAESQRVEVHLFDLAGRVIRSVFAAAMTPSTPRQVPLNATDLVEGVYLYRAVGETFSESRRFIVIR